MMSSDLYRTRVVFYHGRGSAKSEDVEIQLHSPLDIPGLPGSLTEVEYEPELKAYELREGSLARREMYGPEIAATSRWLARIAAAVHQAMAPLLKGPAE